VDAADPAVDDTGQGREVRLPRNNARSPQSASTPPWRSSSRAPSTTTCCRCGDAAPPSSNTRKRGSRTWPGYPASTRSCERSENGRRRDGPLVDFRAHRPLAALSVFSKPRARVDRRASPVGRGIVLSQTLGVAAEDPTGQSHHPARLDRRGDSGGPALAASITAIIGVTWALRIGRAPRSRTLGSHTLETRIAASAKG
jgi:hypothetical protein